METSQVHGGVFFRGLDFDGLKAAIGELIADVTWQSKLQNASRNISNRCFEQSNEFRAAGSAGSCCVGFKAPMLGYPRLKALRTEDFKAGKTRGLNLGAI